MLTTSAVVVCACAVVGPIGTYHIETPLERAAYGVLYTFLCFPLFYAFMVVACYFLRFRKPLEILASLVVVALFASLHTSAVIHTVESLTHPGYAAETGISHGIFFWSQPHPWPL